MTYSKNGLDLTERFETCRLLAYQDLHGVWTVGWGHTGAEVCRGMRVTQDEADALLEKDVAWAAQAVNEGVEVELTQGQFDALVDFVFNVGIGNFMGSTLRADVNAGLWESAAQQFQQWDHVAGKVVADLLRRRADEEQLFREV